VILSVSAPGEAWRFLRGESPRRPKSSPPGEPSVAWMRAKSLKTQPGRTSRTEGGNARGWRNLIDEAYTGILQTVGEFAVPRELRQPRQEFKQSATLLTKRKPARRIRTEARIQRGCRGPKAAVCRKGSDMNLGGPRLSRQRVGTANQTEGDPRRTGESDPFIVLRDGKTDHLGKGRAK